MKDEKSINTFMPWIYDLINQVYSYMPKNWPSGESSKRTSYESLSSWSPSSKAGTGKQAAESF